MSNVVKFEPRRPTIAQADANEIAAVLKPYSAILGRAYPAMMKALWDETTPEERERICPGGFSMLGFTAGRIAWNAIHTLDRSQRPRLVSDLYFLMVLHTSPAGPEVIVSRNELAEMLGVRPNVVSGCLKVLLQLRLIDWKQAPRVPGKKGPAGKVYVIREDVAYSGGDLHARKAAVDVLSPIRRNLKEPAE